MSVIVKCDLQRKLESDLERLKRKLCMGYELKVKWIPNGNEELSGEVKSDTIYVYDEDECEALETLKHEFLDHAIGKIIEPYREMTNKLIMLINEEAYKRKEKLIEALIKLA
ncbi:MAG: hypothetical protein QXH16_06840 [Candidatus Bathyarchaeia archaeon]